MSDSPAGSNPRTPESSGSGSGGGGKRPAVPAAVSLLPPADPLRQANRLPIRVLKMLSAHTGHLLHPEYLQPLSSTPVSPIELDAKKSPLALLAQTCSQIGNRTAPPPKLNSVSGGGQRAGSGEGPRRSAREPPPRLRLLKQLGTPRPRTSPASSPTQGLAVAATPAKTAAPLVSSTSSSSSRPGRQGGLQGPTPRCPPFPPHGAPVSGSSSSSRRRRRSREGPRTTLTAKNGGGLASGAGQERPGAQAQPGASAAAMEPGAHGWRERDLRTQVGAALGLVGAATWRGVSLQARPPVFPLPPSSIGYPRLHRVPYAGYPLSSACKSGLVGGQLSGLGLRPGKPPSSSPLHGASPPSFLQGYPHTSAAPSCSTCSAQRPGAAQPKGGYPWLPRAPLQPAALSSSRRPARSLATRSTPPSCSATGGCQRAMRQHLRPTRPCREPETSAALPWPRPGSAAAAAAAAAASCHLHLPPPAAPGSPGSLSLRSPHTLGLSRYHPYGKSHLSTAGGLAVPSLPTAGPYYSPYALYGQRLASASALGYQ
uniref:Zinc finger protein 703 n=1 Tax=Aotus nancymaae TaxID=37293 RepID=A0A2K5D0N4_AOTNA